MRVIVISIVFLAVVELCACTTPAVAIRADSDTTKRAAQFLTSGDRAKVYFVNGKMIGNVFGLNHKYPSDLYVNSQLIGSMNKDDALVFELWPGTYQFHWSVRSTDPIEQKATAQSQLIQLKGGDVVVLLGEYDLGGSAMFGLVGALVAPPKTSILPGERLAVNGKSFVIPQSCPTSVCAR
jgi:hypothetical protein